MSGDRDLAAAKRALSNSPQPWQMQPRDFVSDVLPKAQATSATVVPRKDVDSDPSNPYAITGGDYSGGKIRVIGPENYPGKPDAQAHTANRVAAHETGHAMYRQDLSPQQQQDWAAIHQKVGVASEAVAKYPRDPSHSFAEAFGQYVTEPEKLQQSNPEIYNYFRTLTGFEYSRKRIK